MGLSIIGLTLATVTFIREGLGTKTGDIMDIGIRSAGMEGARTAGLLFIVLLVGMLLLTGFFGLQWAAIAIALAGPPVMMQNKTGYIGGGIAGLTAAALLAKEGLAVTLLEAHQQPGGCAGTFRRGPWTFDVGATQVAGLEPGGSHERLLRHLGLPLPEAEILDPGCVVDLGDGQPAVQIWRDPQRWRQERQRQFPGSERFWQLCERLHRSNWAFAAGQPVLPPRNLWDLQQLVGALKPATLASGIFGLASVADLLRLSGCSGPQHQRLRRFLDLQLKLYSQEPAERTAALYGVTVLSMVQEPLGLWHLHGSMQALSRSLETALEQSGGELRLPLVVVSEESYGRIRSALRQSGLL